MHEIVDYTNKPPGKPTDWIPITIALTIFFTAAVTVLFFIEPPQEPNEPLKRGSGAADSAMMHDGPPAYHNQ